MQALQAARLGMTVGEAVVFVVSLILAYAAGAVITFLGVKLGAL